MNQRRNSPQRAQRTPRPKFIIASAISAIFAVSLFLVTFSQALVLPNPDPTGPTFSEGWWLQMMVLALFSVILVILTALFTWLLRRKDHADAAQNKKIEDLYKMLHGCQLDCAKSSAEYAKREDLEAAVLRFEGLLTRVHDRLDKVAMKLGVIDEIRGNG